MKNSGWVRAGMAACLAFALLVVSVCGLKMDASAAEIIATVQGKVMTGTTSGMLFLDTKDGKMEIKIDSGTNTSGCKILLPKKTINVALSRGSDEYLHAVTITEATADPTVSLDMNKVSTVTGTVTERTTEEILVLNTPQGEMELKMERTIDLSNCSILVVGGQYTVRCVWGSDSYMHAIGISDGSGSYAAGESQAQVTNVSGTTKTVTGTVRDDTDESILWLKTSEGDYEFKIDDNADTIRGMMLMPGSKLTVSFYRGSDGYHHASSIVGVKKASSATLDDSKTSTVTGKVKSSSDENTLRLETTGGEMELKLDKVESLSGCRVLVAGKKVSVTCKRGSDAYMHAITITAVK